MVEQWTVNPEAIGSSPTEGTKKKNMQIYLHI